MTSRNRLHVGCVVAAGVVFAAAGTAHADPSTAPTPAPNTTAAASPAAVGGDVLDQLAEEYNVGAGGGQLSNLLRTALKLRAMGFKPSKANLEAIQVAMAYRPNQNPLINALKDTIAYQAKIKGQMEILQQAQSQQNANSAVMGAGQMPAAGNPAMPGTSIGVGAPPVAEVPMAPVPVTP